MLLMAFQKPRSELHLHGATNMKRTMRKNPTFREMKPNVAKA